MAGHGRRRFNHVFLDAEGTLYVPKGGRSTWDFWSNPSAERARGFFVLDEGVVEALEVVRDMVDSLCIASRNTAPVLAILLEDFGIADFFDEVLLNGDKGRQIARYLRDNGWSRRDAVMIGDTPSLDIFPVREAGVEAILVDRPYNRWADAERIKGVSDLPSWLRIAAIAEPLGARNATLDDFQAGSAGDADRGGPSRLAKRLIAPTGA